MSDDHNSDDQDNGESSPPKDRMKRTLVGMGVVGADDKPEKPMRDKKTLVGMVQQKASDAASAAKDAAEDAADAVGDAAKEAKDKAGDALNTIREAAASAKDSAGDAVDSAVDSAKDAAESAKDTAGDVADAIKGKASDAASAVKDTADKLTDSAKAAVAGGAGAGAAAAVTKKSGKKSSKTKKSSSKSASKSSSSSKKAASSHAAHEATPSHGHDDHDPAALDSDPNTRPALYLAEYETPDALLQAAAAVRDAKYSKWDCHTPHAIHGMDDAMGLPPTKIGLISFVCGMVGLATAVLMIQYMNNWDYPIIVGGKPTGVGAFPSMVPIMFELTVLLTGFGTLGGLFHLCQLPRHYHPIFESTRFERATDDRFFLSIQVEDDKFDLERTQELLESTHPSYLELVEEKL